MIGYARVGAGAITLNGSAGRTGFMETECADAVMGRGLGDDVPRQVGGRGGGRALFGGWWA